MQIAEYKDPELGDKFEGDMILSKTQIDILNSQSRNGIIAYQYRWWNATVPVEISPSLSGKHLDYVLRAMRQLTLVSCIKFTQRTYEDAYIMITVNI